MYSFKCDYSEGAHPRILDALFKTNLEQWDGYGEDIYCSRAAALIKENIGRDDIDVHFLVGGTQTNFTAISAFLRPHEAVISAATGHICVHETGAIEATGHKILTKSSADGKLTAELIQEVLDEHEDEHMAKPKLVYLSDSTEIGSIYLKSELEAISSICRKNQLYLYMDGARLGSALTSAENDLTLSSIAALVDAFYIGGTKNGALMGEALIICKEELKTDFRYHMKQKGGLLAKGRVLGIQFEALFQDDLYFKLAEHSNKMADILRKGILEQGYSFLTHSPSNQIFPILPNRLIEELEQKYAFYRWKPIDSFHSAIRLVTSWATEDNFVYQFLEDLKA
ncbi:threonine aldolase family protein [Sinanaerobacter chloroacetimidivorans]|uniref:Low specificity L-threonine aldolase n=1 Tax=Sinanaerobacter chloroacetimidivorans TaxID=2818044 RepID=A0A8J7W2H1_9FIRM|nr:low specificity L-threonine aldolase [Sinanaerobacter chloroacetimidivorans]MBR0599682.1 low specificity L-threonine aldolase [Sinanaerobacter chloroacetimidivorans]